MSILHITYITSHQSLTQLTGWTRPSAGTEAAAALRVTRTPALTQTPLSTARPEDTWRTPWKNSSTKPELELKEKHAGNIITSETQETRLLIAEHYGYCVPGNSSENKYAWIHNAYSKGLFVYESGLCPNRIPAAYLNIYSAVTSVVWVTACL